MTKDVMLVTGAGQISMAIARRTGSSGDPSLVNQEPQKQKRTEVFINAPPYTLRQMSPPGPGERVFTSSW